MIKKMIVILTVIASAFTNVTYAQGEDNKWIFTVSDVSGTVDSCEVFCDEGEPMFPVRFLFEAMGAKVTWISETGNILMDFDGEVWELVNNNYQYRWGAEFDNKQISREESGMKIGYSDISGDNIMYDACDLYSRPILINDVNYINMEGLNALTKIFRIKLEIEKDKRRVDVFLLPNPFYLGNMYDESNVELVKLNGGKSEISVLTRDGDIAAISFDDFLLSAGGETDNEYYYEYIEKGMDYIEGFANEAYKSFRYKGDILVLVCGRDSYMYDDGVCWFLYDVRNASHETDETVCFIEQSEINNNPGVAAVGYMYGGKVYMDIENTEKMLRYCGYRLEEYDGTLCIKQFSYETDESLYHEMYK